MVYGGKPSTGCYLCRKRKIKCDEERPGCRNCATYGRPCPGYRPDAIFRNETRKVERLAKKDTNCSSSSSKNNTPSSQALMVADRSLDRSASVLNLHRIADSTWEERAICYFFDQYTVPGDNEEGTGHLEYLPPLYARAAEVQSTVKGSPAACLRWAVDATALMTLANFSNAPPLMIKARQGYGRALRGLRDALASPDTAIMDETFASVLLLSLYEDISGERNGLFSSHTAGFEFLMKLRGEGQLDHQRGRDMFNFAYAHTYVEILALGDKPRHDIDWVLGLLDSNDPVERLMLAASKIRQLFLSMQTAPSPPDLATVEKWIEAGRKSDLELSQWPLHLPDRWLPLVVYSAKGETLMVYKTIGNAVIWNYYRAARVMLQQCLFNLNRTYLSIKNKTRKPDDPSQAIPALDEASLREVVQEMTTDICRSIPFSLSDVDELGRLAGPIDGKPVRAAQAYGLIWPLWYVLSCGMPTEAQFNQIREVLWSIGSTLGIKLALILAREAERMRNESLASAPAAGPSGR
ncbi:transcriptional regulator family: Fungal Specific TF [Penicillium cinerascens]|uniref:Transcriptional regulator family: Fungal Specific TF n=1 Tax=Penicillium cinerascens TaxID=70096 RepID=A0A9W9N976_9EURO|nr:transcriptional regulator family: Fungal Specific TF [Penicillium cinerascens]KAJ5215620.1 transcriptional regulator family: Fungal Specific TF [Penicillium cinerascens]